MGISDVEILQTFMQDILFSEDVKDLDLQLLEEEVQYLGMSMNLLNRYVKELRQFSAALVRGELEQKLLSEENTLCHPLRELQNKLSELTHQTQQIAQGDYSQRVDYLGDFSLAFNSLVQKLQQQDEQYHKQTTDALKRAIEYQDMAYQDHTTQLYNRRYCMRLLTELTSQKLSFAICYLDLDGLKKVNDRLGHQEGDFYIITLADVLRKSFRSYDSICRIGGDEFVVLMENVSKENAIARICQARELFHKFGQEHGLYEMSFSYGIRSVDKFNCKTPKELLNEADRLMYREKRKKR